MIVTLVVNRFKIDFKFLGMTAINVVSVALFVTFAARSLKFASIMFSSDIN